MYTFSVGVVFISETGDNSNSYSSSGLGNNVSLGHSPFSSVVDWVHNTERILPPEQKGTIKLFGDV